MQVIRFENETFKMWQTIGGWNKVILTKHPLHISQKKHRNALRDLIQKGEYLYDDYGFKDRMGRRGIGNRMVLVQKLPDNLSR